MSQGPNPGTILRTGDVFLLLPSNYAKVKIDSWPWGPSYLENGNGVRAGNDFPFPGAFQYSAVLRFNNPNNNGFSGPAQATSFAPCSVWSGVPARLVFSVNDPSPGDNGGEWWFAYCQYLHDRVHP